MKTRTPSRREPLSFSYVVTLRIAIPDRPGMFARIAGAIARTGASLGAMDLVASEAGTKIRDVTVQTAGQDHERSVLEAVKRVRGVRVLSVSDRVFLMHLGGKISIANKRPVTTREALSMVYTPGVARVSLAIAEDRSKSHDLTIRRNTVAVVSDGSAVLGLGNIGPEAAMPVMEGKAMLFKEFADVDAFPICLDTQDPEEVIRVVKWIAPTFGGINLEDIAAPNCFVVEERLKELLDIPVFHDDQHGTAVVVLAALMNAAKVVRKDLAAMKVVVNGAGAAGIACVRILRKAGVKDMIVCDRTGAIYADRAENMNPWKKWVAKNTNAQRFRGPSEKAVAGADVFIGLSGPGTFTARAIRRMARHPIVFALANPTPEVPPAEAERYARIVATGRSDFPNQINNVLAFPGIFRGALDARARSINEAMKMAAARAIASAIPAEHLNEEYIVPSVFDRKVVKAVASAVARAAVRTGVVRRKRSRDPAGI
ncbi:MAG TPA: NAD-dependent malic enzyme [Planctomycetota bacterium]|nr:NAD-dependent malic enzyme [Planctomycetota bacterium]